MADRQKQMEATTELLDQIARVTGTTVRADDIAIFECAAASTRPQNKKGSIYDKSVMSRAMLQEMADRLNAGEASVPLHTLHLQGDELPVGRVFHASVRDEADGSSTLIATFYIGKSHKDLIEGINLSIVDEVSIGVMPATAKCSKCGWDYMSAEAGFENIFMQTCDNDHTIGVDGTHLKLESLADWLELSLVSRGAADKPKILSRAKTLVPAEEYDRMAASGRPAEAVVLFATNKMEIPMKDKTEGTPAAEFDLAGAFDGLVATLEALGEKVESLVAAQNDPAPEPAPAASAEEDTVESLQAKLSEAEAKIAELEQAAAEPAPEPEPEPEPAPEPTPAPSTPEGAPEPAPASEQSLELPVGGLAASAVTDAGKKEQLVLSSAFKSQRRK